METLKFKTNAKCGGCVARIGAELNKSVGGGNWNIDLNTPEKVLTVTSDKKSAEIVALVQAAGYKAEPL